jgi:hypothetical protein
MGDETEKSGIGCTSGVYVGDMGMDRQHKNLF